MNDNKPILRYNANERSNHWLVAILFFLAGLSGLALFHPALFWLSNLFGGGPWTRILHPFLGVAMFVFFVGLVVRFWRANFITATDRLWLRRCRRPTRPRARQTNHDAHHLCPPVANDRRPRQGRRGAPRGRSRCFW